MVISCGEGLQSLRSRLAPLWLAMHVMTLLYLFSAASSQAVKPALFLILMLTPKLCKLHITHHIISKHYFNNVLIHSRFPGPPKMASCKAVLPVL